MSCTVSGRRRDPVDERHQVPVGGSGGIELVGLLLEFLAQVEDLLFEFAEAASQLLDVIGAADAAGVEDLFAESFGEAGGEVGVVAAEPQVLLFEVGQVGEQRLPVAAVEAGLVPGVAARAWIWARRSWWR